MAGIWKSLSVEKKLQLMQRKYAGEDVGLLAAEIGINTVSLNRRLQELRAKTEGRNIKLDATDITVPPEKKLPDFTEMFDLLRKGWISLAELSRRYDRSEETIIDLIEQMEDTGYVVERKKNLVTVDTVNHPKIDYKPSKTLADEVGSAVTFAVASDGHAGSTHAQISARRKFIEIAYHEYNVRHIFDPGDTTAGIHGYRGQDYDLIPSARPMFLKSSGATEAQIWLADTYQPALPGLRYYILGGNHDYWHIVNSGINAVKTLCGRRDDSIYLGYDVADVPITDRVAVRLWHPSGGQAYALSYRLQKGMEQLAFDELSRAVELNENPKVRFLLAGHMHIEVKFHRGPMVAAHVGCFEGQTNYLKRKGLYPTIGGSIFRVLLTDSGVVQRVEYTFIPFNEVPDDWKNYPQPQYDMDTHADKIDVLFKLTGKRAGV